jgi:hypothetical protein
LGNFETLKRRDASEPRQGIRRSSVWSDGWPQQQVLRSSFSHLHRNKLNGSTVLNSSCFHSLDWAEGISPFLFFFFFFFFRLAFSLAFPKKIKMFRARERHFLWLFHSRFTAQLLWNAEILHKNNVCAVLPNLNALFAIPAPTQQVGPSLEIGRDLDFVRDGPFPPAFAPPRESWHWLGENRGAFWARAQSL